MDIDELRNKPVDELTEEETEALLDSEDEYFGSTAEGEMETLSDCLTAIATQSTQIGVFLMELILRKGQEKKENEIQSRISLECIPKVEFAGDNVRLSLRFENSDSMDLRLFNFMWEDFWKRNTEAFLHQKEGIEIHFNYEIQCVSIVDGKTYIMSFVNPVYGSLEKDGIIFFFSKDNVTYTIQENDYSRIDREVDYEQRTGEYAPTE